MPANTVDGEVRFFCQAGFVSRFKLADDLNGAQRSHTTADLPVGREQTFTLPDPIEPFAGGDDVLRERGWKPLFTRKLDRPTFIGFTAYGTVFEPKFKDEYPEISNIVAQPNELTLTHECIKIFGTTLGPKWNNECR